MTTSIADRIVLGAMLFGTRIAADTAFDLLDRYVEGGGVRIDTADCYAFWSDPSGHGGQSEELLGEWLRRRPGLREKIRLATKVGAEPVVPGSYPGRTQGLSDEVVRTALIGSLRRLGTDRVDLYWAHKQDPDTPVEDTALTFGGLADDGYVGAVGLSNHPAWQVERARRAAVEVGLPAVTAVQLSHSYLRPRPWAPTNSDHPFGLATDADLDLAAHAGLTVWAYSPLLSGAYDRSDRPLPPGYRHAGTDARLAALAEVAGELGVPRSQVVLAWLLGGTPPVVPIVGVSTAAQLDSALAGVALELTPDQRERLDAAC